MTDYAERVERGAAFLDEHAAGWESRIDDQRLAMNLPCRCILGQIFKEQAAPYNGYEWAIVEFSDNEKWYSDGAFRWSIWHGFTTEDGRPFQQLEDAWLDLMADRRIERRVEAAARQAGRL
jgi:hypothetical protein